MARERRGLAEIISPVLLKPHESGRCLIAEGRFNTRAPLASTRILGSLVAGARFGTYFLRRAVRIKLP